MSEKEGHICIFCIKFKELTLQFFVQSGDVATGVINAVFDNDAPGNTYYCVG